MSNLIWVGVTLALCAWWFARRHAQHKHSLLPEKAVQLLALLVLAAVLLPVISLTSDLQAATNPAETERVARRADWQPSADPPLHRVPMALALQIAPAREPAIPAAGLVTVRKPFSLQARGFFPTFTTRPPPTA